MAIKLNHTIVHSTDPRAAAQFYASVFGLPAPKPFGPFLDLEVANEVTLAFLDADGMEIQTQRERGLKEGRINHHFGGRGVYFEDPSGHLLEIITRPYGEFPKAR